ncbi:MAG TPA: hypothetical protein VFW28_00055 [Micropepsaceae bacterium]|nr:hypothetical protein [Micropepsaceae bacterium]
MILARVQDWFADHGIGGYAMPRGRPRRRRPSNNAVFLRFGVGTLGLFGTIVLIALMRR